MALDSSVWLYVGTSPMGASDRGSVLDFVPFWTAMVLPLCDLVLAHVERPANLDRVPTLLAELEIGPLLISVEPLLCFSRPMSRSHFKLAALDKDHLDASPHMHHLADPSISLPQTSRTPKGFPSPKEP